VLILQRQLPAAYEAQDAGRQLLRAATSVRSNDRAARKSRTRAAFRAKLQIALEEADECVDWLQYLEDGRIQENAALLKEARELASILGRAVQTARGRSLVD
jgi:four helix bundle protein